MSAPRDRVPEDAERRALGTPTAHATRTMRANRGRDTGPEISLRRALHRAGLRFRVHRRLDVSELRVRPDIVFGPSRVAVFVDGCFWHGCPEHASWPKKNAKFWRDKIERNRERDRSQNAALEAAGWAAVRVWEHESAEDAAARIVSLVAQRRTDRTGVRVRDAG